MLDEAMAREVRMSPSVCISVWLVHLYVHLYCLYIDVSLSIYTSIYIVNIYRGVCIRTGPCSTRQWRARCECLSKMMSLSLGPPPPLTQHIAAKRPAAPTHECTLYVHLYGSYIHVYLSIYMSFYIVSIYRCCVRTGPCSTRPWRARCVSLSIYVDLYC